MIAIGHITQYMDYKFNPEDFTVDKANHAYLANLQVCADGTHGLRMPTVEEQELKAKEQVSKQANQTNTNGTQTTTQHTHTHTQQKRGTPKRKDRKTNNTQKKHNTTHNNTNQKQYTQETEDKHVTEWEEKSCFPLVL